MKNLWYYCRHRIEVLADKQGKFGCYTELGLSILLFRVQIKSHVVHLIWWHYQMIFMPFIGLQTLKVFFSKTHCGAVF